MAFWQSESRSVLKFPCVSESCSEIAQVFGSGCKPLTTNGKLPGRLTYPKSQHLLPQIMDGGIKHKPLAHLIDALPSLNSCSGKREIQLQFKHWIHKRETCASLKAVRAGRTS